MMLWSLRSMKTLGHFATVPLLPLVLLSIADKVWAQQNLLQANVQSLNLTASLGGPPVSQVINVSSSVSSAQLLAQSNATWLTVELSPGTMMANTPSSVTVKVYPTAISLPGTYNGAL